MSVSSYFARTYKVKIFRAGTVVKVASLAGKWITYLAVVLAAVEAGNVHPSVEHVLHSCNIIASRAKGTHDLGLPKLYSDWFEDVFEINSIAPKVCLPNVVNRKTLIRFKR